jgi:hypothetical protein
MSAADLTELKEDMELMSVLLVRAVGGPPDIALDKLGLYK